MFRFTRTVTIGPNVLPPAALQMAQQLGEHVRKNYDVDVKVGMQLFGKPAIYWYADTEDLAKITTDLARLMGDQEYLGLIDRARTMWLPGSFEDCVVRLL